MLNMKTTEKDTIFFFYNDHGLPDLISTPVESHIYSWEFNNVLRKMKQRKMFSKFFVALEACYSGSFTDMLSVDDVIIMTAARNNETSYGAMRSQSRLVVFSNEFTENFFTFMDNKEITIDELFNKIYPAMTS